MVGPPAAPGSWNELRPGRTRTSRAAGSRRGAAGGRLVAGRPADNAVEVHPATATTSRNELRRRACSPPPSVHPQRRGAPGSRTVRSHAGVAALPGPARIDPAAPVAHQTRSPRLSLRIRRWRASRRMLDHVEQQSAPIGTTDFDVVLQRLDGRPVPSDHRPCFSSSIGPTIAGRQQAMLCNTVD